MTSLGKHPAMGTGIVQVLWNPQG